MTNIDFCLSFSIAAGLPQNIGGQTAHAVGSPRQPLLWSSPA